MSGEPLAEVDCPYGDDSLVVADYLAERLAEDAAERFEEHALACRRCAEELAEAIGIRAALSTEDAARVGRGAASGWDLRPLAAAEDPLAATIDRSRSRLEIRWKEVPGADRYLLRSYDPAGNLIAEREPRAPWAELPLAPGEVPAFVRVVALDLLGRRLDASLLIPVPAPPAADPPPR